MIYYLAPVVETEILVRGEANHSTFDSHHFQVPYFRYYKTPLYLFLRLFGHSSRPRTLFFLASLELLVRLLFKGVLYSRASYNSGNTAFQDNSFELFYTANA